MKRFALLNVVGLTPRLIGDHTPRIQRHCRDHRTIPIRPALPALTCTAQSSYITGTTPAQHGIVANGWYNRELAEVQFWKQSNQLVHGPKVWETLRQRHPGFTCAKLFCWYNMYSSADWSITPRPMYPADGRKVFDVYAWPHSLRSLVKSDLGEFPFAGFWGPAAGRRSPQGAPDCATRWIADSARWIEEHHSPHLNLVYLPHLDYNLQRFGPTHTSGRIAGSAQISPVTASPLLNPRIVPDLCEIDAIVGELLDFFGNRGVQPLLISEYGITNVSLPIHLNRIFRKLGWLVVKEELGLELLDPGASRVFAVADHQIAHIYVNDPKLFDLIPEVLSTVAGIGMLLGPDEKRDLGLDHARSGDWIALARENAWFTYYYWDNDELAPDFARCVDIHRKPGYDPVELFSDPALHPLLLKAKVGWRLLQKRLGFRMLMDIVPLDPDLVRGSHGCRPADRLDWPILTVPKVFDTPKTLEAAGVRDVLLDLYERPD